MHPFICNIFGPFSISWYGFFVVLGVSTFIYLAYTDIRRSAILSTNQFLDCATAGAFGGIVGGKLLFLANQAAEYSCSTWTDFFALLVGGYAILGAMVGALLGIVLAARWHRVHVISLLDLCGAYALSAHAISRLGCFVAGCCWGLPFAGGMVYSHPASLAPLHVELFPIQLAMVALSLLGFLICRHLYGQRGRREGLVFGIYLIWESGARFLIDFWRGDRVIWLGGLGVYQWIALGVVLSGLLFLRYKVFIKGTRRRW